MIKMLGRATRRLRVAASTAPGDWQRGTNAATVIQAMPIRAIG
jgi:hypothetical protein